MDSSLLSCTVNNVYHSIRANLDWSWRSHSYQLDWPVRAARSPLFRFHPPIAHLMHLTNHGQHCDVWFARALKTQLKEEPRCSVTALFSHDFSEGMGTFLLFFNMCVIQFLHANCESKTVLLLYSRCYCGNTKQRHRVAQWIKCFPGYPLAWHLKV